MEQLKSKLSPRAKVTLPSDADYDKCRNEIWNGDIRKFKPLFFVHVGCVSDVQEILKYCVDNKIDFTVTNQGAHSTHSIADGCVAINLNQLRSAEVNPKNKTVRAEGGCMLGDVDHVLGQYKLGIVAGTISHTGLVGLTLGGGIGYLTKAHNLACDNVIEYEIVLADGRFVKASKTENPDLYNGMKGSGFNFGIVTALTYQAYDVTDVYTGLVIFPFNIAKQVLQTWRQLVNTYRKDPDFTNLGAIAHSPDGHKCIIFHFVLFGKYSSEEKAKAVLKPLLDLNPVANHLHPDTYKNAQKAIDVIAPHGALYYENSVFTNDFPDEMMDSLLADYSNLPKELLPTSAIIMMDPSEINPKPLSEAAFSHRAGRNWWFANLSTWSPAGGEHARDIAKQYTKSVIDHIDPTLIIGNYINAHNEGDDVNLYYKANLTRLQELKHKYDPNNVFHHNNNIKPVKPSSSSSSSSSTSAATSSGVTKAAFPTSSSGVPIIPGARTLASPSYIVGQPTPQQYYFNQPQQYLYNQTPYQFQPPQGYSVPSNTAAVPTTSASQQLPSNSTIPSNYIYPQPQFRGYY